MEMIDFVLEPLGYRGEKKRVKPAWANFFAGTGWAVIIGDEVLALYVIIIGHRD